MIVKPISDLKDYNKVMSAVTPGNPVIISKNGRDAYVIMLSDDYSKKLAIDEINALLQESFDSIKNRGKTFTTSKLRAKYAL